MLIQGLSGEEQYIKFWHIMILRLQMYIAMDQSKYYIKIIIEAKIMKEQINEVFQSPFYEKEDHLINTTLEQNVELQEEFRHENEGNEDSLSFNTQGFDYEASLVMSPEEWVSLENQESQHITIQEDHTDIPQINGPTPIQRNANMQSKKQKNSNAIKKIGRLILDNIKLYNKTQMKNEGVSQMLKQLSKKSKVGRTQVNKRDKFNTYFLRLLFQTSDSDISKFNLWTTRDILTKNLRGNILQSKQITNQNKLLYLNTLKCSALRCMNKNIAIRLQMSE